MEIIFDDHEKYQEYYLDILNEIHDYSWGYLPEWKLYQRIYATSSILKDLSFIVVDNGRSIAYCPLFLEKHNNYLSFSFAGGYLNSPLIKSAVPNSYKKKIEKYCFEKIDELAGIHNVKKAMFSVEPVVSGHKYNILMEYGYMDSSLNTIVVDLQNSEKELWANLRKSYQSIINKGNRTFEICVFDHTNPSYDTHELYREYHYKAAGRITRLKETFDLQYEMLRNNKAVLIGIKYENHFIAFSYFFHNTQAAYYASSSDDDSDLVKGMAFEHSIIWAAIKYYKEKGLNFLELGFALYKEHLFDQPSDKEINISFFKKGFGGALLPLFRGIKYFDTALKISELQNKIENLK